MTKYGGNNVPKCKIVIQHTGPDFDFTNKYLNKHIKYQVKNIFVVLAFSKEVLAVLLKGLCLIFFKYLNGEGTFVPKKQFI